MLDLSALTKEQVYDDRINPLMAQIIDICTARGIAMVASFSIPTPEDADLCCTTNLPDENGNPPQMKLVLRNPAFAVTVMGGKSHA